MPKAETAPRIMGVPPGSWLMWLLGLVLAGLVGLGGWTLTIRDQAHNAATKSDIDSAIDEHVEVAAPPVKEVQLRVRAIETKQSAMQRDIDHIGKGVQEIQQELRRSRRTRRRDP